jgi:hypothetical protein
MNTKFYSCLLALGTFASAVLLSLTPVSAQTGNGSNTSNNIQPIPGNGSNTSNNANTSNPLGNTGNGSNTSNNANTSNPGNGSNTGNNASTSTPQQPTTVQVTAQEVAKVNEVLTGIVAANPQALTSVTSPEALVPPEASQNTTPEAAAKNTKLVEAAKALSSSVAGLNAGQVTGEQLNNTINAYNTYAEALVESVGGEKAVAFLSSAGGVKSKDGTPAPSLRSQLLKLREAAGV